MVAWLGCRHGSRWLCRLPRMAWLQHGPKWWHRPQAPAWSPGTTGATDFNRGPLSYSRALGRDLAIGHSPGPDVSLVLGGQLAIHVCLFLITLASPDLPLSPAHKPSASPSLLLPHCTLTTVVPYWPAPGLLVGSWWHLIEYCLSLLQVMA